MHDDAPGPASILVFTIGHSTRSLDELVTMLHAHGVRRLIDVRSLPRSRRHPHFDAERLAESLPAAGIAYTHLPALGGHRRPRPDSPNRGLTHEAFRGYADWMQTDAFAAGIDELVAIAGAEPTAFMCAEAVPWRCHRSLIADELVARGHRVRHILGAERAQPHDLHRAARIQSGHVTYPGPPDLGF